MNWRRAFIFALAAWGGELFCMDKPVQGVVLLMASLVIAALTEKAVRL